MSQHAVALSIIANPEDLELARRASGRDDAAFRTIMQRYNTRLYHIARAILRNDSEAEDAVQESYVRAFTNLDTFRGESSLGTWLTRIVMNEAMDRQRRAGRSAAHDENNILPFPHATTGDNPERITAQREIQQLVETAIDHLPCDYRLILITRIIEGMSVEETAQSLDLSIETVKTRLHRARALLRERLEDQTDPIMMTVFPFMGERCARLTAAVLGRMTG